MYLWCRIPILVYNIVDTVVHCFIMSKNLAKNEFPAKNICASNALFSSLDRKYYIFMSKRY